jgi:hypothetical protein
MSPQILPPLFSSCIRPSEFRTFANQLTNRHDFDKAKSVSAIDLDNRRLAPVTRFLGMPRKRSQPAQGKPRTDAQQNRERILEVAKEMFARSGASTSLDDIAKLAGVGRGLCIATFLRAMPFSRRTIGVRLKGSCSRAKASSRHAPIEALRS